ncbi:MAG: hypothetical protein CM15mV34_1400 [Caudoviricetes sp.]|nr:MAG: hypothetical protein CM15mV34_1400 [Caudoviricetes sp.]
MTSTTKTDSAIDYENPWLCEGSTFTSDNIGDFFGFVYRITNLQTMGENILEENTFMRSELQREKRENKNKNPIGKSITDLAQN